MHFDDRLATVLRQAVTGQALARIQYRQLLDLLGAFPATARSAQLDAAWLRLGELSGMVPAAERAAVVRQPGLRLRNPRLIAALAEQDINVAAAAIAQASLDEEQWLDLIPALPIAARGILRHRRDLGTRVEVALERLGIADRGLPPAAIANDDITVPEPAVSDHAMSDSRATVLRPARQAAEQAPSESETGDAIRAIVRRIEEFRRTRPPAPSPTHDAPRLPLAETGGDAAARQVTAIDFATDGDGRISWADADVAPMVIGLRLFGDGDAGERRTLPAFTLRRCQPVRAAMIELEGAPAIAGDWQVDASPRFDSMRGRFLGYAGRLRRQTAGAPASTRSAAPAASDRMRQILHELRTPVNAIQGFAEMTQQGLHGPLSHEYRSLAASIAGDAARIMAAFDELDRMVRLDSGALQLDSGETDLSGVVTATLSRLSAFTGPRSSGFAYEREGPAIAVAMQRTDAERLIWRLLAGLAGAAVPGEVLKLRLRNRGNTARLTVRLPEALAKLDDAALFRAGADGHAQALSSGVFGLGFSLRLAVSEAASVGGVLERKDDRLRLALPLRIVAGLTGAAAAHSEDDASAVSGR